MKRLAAVVSVIAAIGLSACVNVAVRNGEITRVTGVF
jgi:hypothetical protein